MWICLYLLLNNIYLPFILLYLSNITLKKTVKKIMLYDKQRKFAKRWESGKQEGRVVQQGVGAQAGRTIGKSVDSSLTLMRSLWILLKKYQYYLQAHYSTERLLMQRGKSRIFVYFFEKFRGFRQFLHR